MKGEGKMRRRIVSGIFVAVVICLIILSGIEIFDLACSLLAAIAIYEVYEAFRIKGFKPIYIAGYIACACIFLGSIDHWNRFEWGWLRRIITFVDIRLLLYLSLLVMFCFIIFRTGKYTVADISVTILGAFYVCFLFWYLMMTRTLRAGQYAVWFIFLGSVVTDTFAFFIGRFFGKTKLIPEISPKKTVEGAVGGALACVIVFVLYGVLIFDKYAYPNPFWQYAIMGFACGIVAQIGDLAASSIKRYCGIKDFGKIIPGHGGILDRMDSAILISPLVYVMITVIDKV